MSKLPTTASVANALEGVKLCAPSAARNTAVIVELLAGLAPSRGRALEIASGTGQHIVTLAAALPALDWQPTDIDASRRASIDAYAAEARLPNLRAARHLDAARPGWGAEEDPFDLIHLANLLHLIPQPAAQTVLKEAAAALRPSGQLVVYGPFTRAGTLTSDGDRRFDAQLRAADLDIGYKDDTWVEAVLNAAGLTVIQTRDMPANNLAFIAAR